MGPNLGKANAGSAWLMEFYCSFLFYICIMQVKEPRLHVHYKNTIVIFIGVCIVLSALIYMAGPVSGGCFNPAVAFGLYLMCAINDPSAGSDPAINNHACSDYLLLYMSASAAAAVVAGLAALLLANWTTWLTPAGAKLVETPNTRF